jgi:hypothetical protein
LLGWAAAIQVSIKAAVVSAITICAGGGGVSIGTVCIPAAVAAGAKGIHSREFYELGFMVFDFLN